jgi:capsular polysaccharide transport system permease protein
LTADEGEASLKDVAAIFTRANKDRGGDGFFRTQRMLLPGPRQRRRAREIYRHLSGLRLDGRMLRRLAIGAFVAPTLIATLYYGLIASDRYVSESDFIVRGMSTRRASGLDMLFQTFGISRAVDDTNAVQQYMLSRDAVRALEARLPLREIFSNRKGDVFARFPSFWQIFDRDAFERLYDYYLDHVTVVQDRTKGITALKVVTFDAADSRRVATTLLRLAEEMVNRMNERAQNDAVRSARADVELAESRLMKTQLDLTGFRNKELLIDPNRSSVSVLETITNLSTELTHTMALIQETAKTAPDNPALGIWRAKTAALQSQIDREREKIAGRDGALAPKVADYERLSLSRDLAERGLVAATASLEAARQEARRQQIYVEEIMPPNLPDEAGEPRRLRSITTVIVLTLSVAAIFWILTVGAKEHAH